MKKKVSFIIAPNFSRKYISKTFSYTTLKILLGILGIVFLGIVFMFLFSLKIYYKLGELTYLKIRNESLEKEIVRLKKIELTLKEIDKERKKLLIMLGIEKVPKVKDFTNLIFNYYTNSHLYSKLNITDTTDTAGVIEDELFYLQVPPTVGFFITRPYSKDHPGIDFATSLGKPVFAVADGVVEKTGYNDRYGNFVIIRHTVNYKSFYGHLEDIIVSEGDSVKARDVIGHVGSTGKSTAPHLHFELWHRGVPIDPSHFFVFRRIRLQQDSIKKEVKNGKNG